jgi:hypothetical protein
MMEAALAAAGMLLCLALSLVRLRPLTVVRAAVHALAFVAVFASLLGTASLAFGIEFGFGSTNHWLSTALVAAAIGFAFPGSSSIAEWLLVRYWPAQARPAKGLRWRARRPRRP